MERRSGRGPSSWGWRIANAPRGTASGNWSARARRSHRNAKRLCKPVGTRLSIAIGDQTDLDLDPLLAAGEWDDHPFAVAQTSFYEITAKQDGRDAHQQRPQ